MAEIKSALEIALAKTEGVKSDKEGVRLKELAEKGKRMASRFLNEHQDPEKLAEEIRKEKKEDREKAVDGVFQVLKANFILPQTEDYQKNLNTLKEGFSVLGDEKEQLTFIFEQVDQFFQQYIQSKEQLIENLKERMLPLAQSKSQQISQQRGVQITLNPEDLPEYAQALNENMAQLTGQYQDALNNLKKDLNDKLSPA